MRRRKTIIGIAVAFALTLLVAGSAYAVTAGEPRGYRGGSEAGQSTTVEAQDANAQNPETTCPAGGDQDRSCDQLRDGSCEECDGNGTRAGVAQGAGSTQPAGATTQTRARTGECEGTCEQERALTRTRTRDCEGECEPTQSQTQARTQTQTQTQAQTQTQTQLQTTPQQCPQDGARLGEGPNGPEGQSNGPGPNNDPGRGGGSCPAGAGNGLGNGAGR